MRPQVNAEDSATDARRADARRNRARVLEVAGEAFAADGAAVSLGEIAKRAGVGAGTVYRHFPRKEDLLGQVLSDRVTQMTGYARELFSRGGDPGEAFFEMFHTIVAHATVNRALCDTFKAGVNAGPCSANIITAEFRAELGTLLRHAQEAGAVRADLTVDDVNGMIAGALAAEAAAGTPGRLAHYIADGLRPPGGTVTKPLSEERNETSGETRNETGDETRCEVCGTPVTTARTGRPARYCGAACRQKAHRMRAAR